MPPKPWPIVVDGLYGDVPTGMFPAKDTSRELVLLPFGGLQKLCQLPNCSEVREGWSWGGYMYWFARRGSQSVLFRVDEYGGVMELGVVVTSAGGPAWIRNNITQLCVVDGVSGYVYTPATGSFQQILDPDFMGAGGLEYQDGYGLFFQPDSNLWFFSAINDFLSFDGTDQYYKLALTDNIRGIRSFQREPYIFGTEKGTEVWYNAGGDNSSIQNPTFARNTGGLIMYGQASPKCDSDMAGTAVTWLSSQGQLVQASGTNATPVSNNMFDREVAGDGTLEHPGYSTIADAVAFSYRDQGHIFHQVTFPSADVTWLLDGATQLMLKRQSYKVGGGYGRHRANCYTLHNKKHYVGDFENGCVYQMSTNFFTDDGYLIPRVLYSQEIFGGKDIVSFPDIQVLLEAGAGLPGGADPQIGLEFSADGGKTWSNMVNRSAGLVGQYTRQANFRQMGSAYRRMYRLTMTDPILWRIVGLDLGV